MKNEGITHRHLLTIVPRRIWDYPPFGHLDRETAKDGDWGPDCSSGCKWAAWLDSELGLDWCVCTNPASNRVGLLTFEHQGCTAFESEE